MTQAMKHALWILVAFTVFGCQSSSGPKFNLVPRRVTIITVPAGAKVEQCDPFRAPSGLIGVTPITDATVAVMTNFRGRDIPLELTKAFIKYDGNLGVRISKEGYKTYVGVLKTTPSETTVHEITLEPTDE